MDTLLEGLVGRETVREGVAGTRCSGPRETPLRPRVGLGPLLAALNARPRVGLGPRETPLRPLVGLGPRETPLRPLVGLGLRETDSERRLSLAGLTTPDIARRVGLGAFDRERRAVGSRETSRRPRVGLGAFDRERRAVGSRETPRRPRVGLGAFDIDRRLSLVGLGARDMERRVGDGLRDMERRVGEGLREMERRVGLRFIDRGVAGTGDPSISTPRMSHCRRVVDLNAATAIAKTPPSLQNPSQFLLLHLLPSSSLI